MRPTNLTATELAQLSEQLYEACEKGNVAEIRALIEREVDVDLITNNGWTSLEIACEKGHTEAIKLLIEAGADVNKTHNNDWTPLEVASINGHAEAIKLLIEAGANVNKDDIDGETPLYLASKYGRYEAIKILLAYGADLNQTPTLKKLKDLTALQFAVLSQDLSKDLTKQKQIIQALFDYGADVSVFTDAFFAKHQYQLYITGYITNIPVSLEIKQFIASLNNQQSIDERDQRLIELNKEKDANIARVDEFIAQKKAQEQALIEAINSANITEITRLVAQENVYVNFFNEAKQNPLLIALASEQLSETGKKPEVIQTLLSLKASPTRSLYLAVIEDKSELLAELLKVEGADIKMIYGSRDLIQIAVLNNSTKSIAKLLELGFDVNKKYDYGETLIHLASFNGNNEVTKFLIEAGADVNLADDTGRTPLFIASVKEYLEIIELLIKAGADVNKGDNDGWTPLRQFTILRNIEAIKTLLLAGANFFKFESDSHLQNLIRALELITPEELAEIKQQPEKLKKIQESGVYDLLRIVNLQCSNSDTEEQRQNLEQQKQNFLRRIFIQELEPINFENSDSDQELEFRSELEFLKLFPLISKILDSTEFSTENKLKIIEIIAEKPDDFKKQVYLIVNFPTLRKIDDDKSEAFKLSLTEFLPKEIKNLLIDRTSLLTLIDIILNQHPLQTQAGLKLKEESPSTIVEPSSSNKQKSSFQTKPR